MQFLNNSASHENLATGTRRGQRLGKHVSSTIQIFIFASLALLAGPALAASENIATVTQVEVVEPGGITSLPQTASTSQVQLEFAIRDDVALSLAVPDGIVVTSATQEAIALSVDKPLSATPVGDRNLKLAVRLPSTRDPHRGEYTGNMTVLAQYN